MHKRQSDASSDHRQLHGAHRGSWPESVSDSSIARWRWNDKGLTCSYSYTLSGLCFSPKVQLFHSSFPGQQFLLWKSNEIKKKNNFYFQILWCKPQIHKWKCGLKSHSSSLETGSYFISFTSAHFIDGFWGHRECHKAGTWAVRQPDRFYTNPQFKLIT